MQVLFILYKTDLNDTLKKKSFVPASVNLSVVVVVLFEFIKVCPPSALHQDEDEKFDRSLFTVPRYFNGSFQVSSQPVSNKTQVLADLQDQV